MKKYLVLGVLFVLPILAYLFFASGVNNFGRLPVLHNSVTDIDGFVSLDGEEVTLDGHISILAFLGTHPELKKTNAFNLNQKIYKRFNGFQDFQFVVIMPEGTREKVIVLREELRTLADVGNWNFVFASPSELQSVYQSLNVPYVLGDDLGTDRVFIIDKSRSLRGRSEDEDYGELFGYDATSVAEINNKMVDDVKVLLAEYRLALKKNSNKPSVGRDSILKKKM